MTPELDKNCSLRHFSRKIWAGLLVIVKRSFTCWMVLLNQELNGPPSIQKNLQKGETRVARMNGKNEREVKMHQ